MGSPEEAAAAKGKSPAVAAAGAGDNAVQSGGPAARHPDHDHDHGHDRERGRDEQQQDEEEEEEEEALPSYEEAEPWPGSSSSASAAGGGPVDGPPPPPGSASASGPASPAAAAAGPSIEDPFNFPPPYTPPPQAAGAGADAGTSSSSPPQPPGTAAAGSSSAAAASSATAAAAAAGGPGAEGLRLPVAIPQVHAEAAAPFLDAYAPALLAYGVPASSWRPFLATLSAFLSARVSDRAVAHAGDMARHIPTKFRLSFYIFGLRDEPQGQEEEQQMQKQEWKAPKADSPRFTRHAPPHHSVGSVPKSFGQQTLAHVKEVGRGIGSQLRSGNVPGAAVQTIGRGLVGIPVAAAGRAVGALFQLPGAAVTAVAGRPRTPRERAQAYVAVANGDWFLPRGLRAVLCDTRDLAATLGIDAAAVLDATRAAAKGGAAAQMDTLADHVERLEVPLPATLAVSPVTLWLVVVPLTPEDAAAARQQAAAAAQAQTQARDRARAAQTGWGPDARDSRRRRDRPGGLGRLLSDRSEGGRRGRSY
ncbi:hypothetical protein GGR56DRAFT_686589 [Xylariaceae sp. FL0804]|nr:hypothetical protein GGR56DRAFT_686589 [Xylariaceae sp. FL0804]